MIQLLPGAALFILFIFLFIREVKLDEKRYREQDRLGDEHIMREIEKFIKEKQRVIPSDVILYNEFPK